MKDKETFKKLRFTGRIENYMIAKHSLGFYNNVSVSAFYTRSSPLDIQHLQFLVYRAVKEVITDHPALGISIADEDKPRPYYVQLPTIDLSKAITFISSDTIPNPSDSDGAKALDLLLEEQHNRNFKNRAPQDPLWRLLIVHEPTESSRFVACFVYHHAICDGTSGLVFHRHLLKKLSQISTIDSAQKADAIVATSSKAFLPSLEELHPLPLSTLFFLKANFKEYIAINKPKRRTWTAAPTTTDPSKRTSRFRDSIGTWVSRYDFQHRYVPRGRSSHSDTIKLFSWEDARKVKATIQKEIENQGKDSIVGLLKHAGDVHKLARRRIGKRRAESFELSNIGVFGHDQQANCKVNNWSVGRVIFSQSADVVGAAIEVSLVTGNDGSLNVGFTWLDGIVEGSMMERVIGAFERTVEDVVQKT
ncbi:Alcohol acetyltransferase [Penicillium occitanis (nom. inval.)]|nr:Alcohol acetyltransferase [Penicillium occitanis (nom. inval.)]PCG97790.1 hypothetical protein PENOC_066300 [Penicillium occitanis (nom. inval.)]